MKRILRTIQALAKNTITLLVTLVTFATAGTVATTLYYGKPAKSVAEDQAGDGLGGESRKLSSVARPGGPAPRKLNSIAPGSSGSSSPGYAGDSSASPPSDGANTTSAQPSPIGVSNAPAANPSAGLAQAVAAAQAQAATSTSASSSTSTDSGLTPPDDGGIGPATSTNTSTDTSGTNDSSITTATATVTGKWFDSSGDLLIADSVNNVLRSVSAATYEISTIAGANGNSADSGDGGAAASAVIGTPMDLAVDSSGNIYFADSTNNVVREISATTGLITTVAGTGAATYTGDGGAATAATLNYPTALAIDSSGNLYIADSHNYVIREVAIATGIISTVAGSNVNGSTGNGGAATSAKLSSPIGGLAVDSSGNLYIADTANHMVREVSATTGLIAAYAGSGVSGYTGDSGAPAAAELKSPAGVAVDSSGNVFIADVGAFVIREVSVSTGLISTCAGNGTSGYLGDGAAATSAELTAPRGLSVDNSGNIYVADGNTIREVSVSTGNIGTVAGNGTAGYTGDGGVATSAELDAPFAGGN